MEIAVLPPHDVRNQAGDEEIEDVKNERVTNTWWRDPKIKAEQTQDELRETQDADAYDVYTRSKMFRAMRPLFYSLTIIGMYHRKRYGSLKECCRTVPCDTPGENYDKQHSRKKSISPTMIYSCCLLILSVLNYLRLFSMFGTGDIALGPAFIMKCSMTTWFSQALVCLIVGIRASHNYDCVPKFFVEWQKLNNSVPSLDLKFEHIRKVTVIVVTIAWVFITISIFTIVYALFFHPDNFAALFSPMAPDHEHILLMKIALVLFLPTMIAGWSFGIVMDFLFSYVLYKLFYIWREKFRERCARSTVMTTSELSHEQTKHQRICRLVHNVEDFLSLYKALSFVGNIGIMLFVMYSLVYASAAPEYQDPISIAMNVLWMLMSTISLSSMCITAVKVNTVAHSVFDDVIELQTKLNHSQVQLFLCRLTGENIGLSALGMFVFDKSSIVTTLGMLLSYFIVMLQFNPGSSDSAATCACNCSLTV